MAAAVVNALAAVEYSHHHRGGIYGDDNDITEEQIIIPN